MTGERAPRRQRVRRWVLLSVLLLALLHGCAIVAQVPISWPFDVVINAGGAPVRDDLRAPDDGKRRVAVLQHGMWRTAASMGRLERTLQAHGYEVWNEGYASTAETIQAHAERLHAQIERVFAQPVDELFLIGHSMGGVVIQQYLRRPDARLPTSCVYLATPHRGAMLVDLRKHWFLFRLFMGDQAALQLSPGDAIHRQPVPLAERAGVLVGNLGAGNGSIPGDDDGTVAVGEAMLDGAAATAVLPIGHTRMSMHPDVCVQVLHFLRRGIFAPVAAER